MDIFRVGRISALNVAKSYARVVYEDRDQCVTSEMPIFNLGFIYWLPKIGDPVMVLHLDNGGEAGLILNRYYCDENQPPETGEEFFRMEFERGKKSFLRHKEGEVTELYAPNGVLVTATDKGVEVECTQGGYKLTATAGGVQIDAAQGGVTIDASSGGITITGDVTITGNVTITGLLSTTGGISTQGEVQATGIIQSDTDVCSGTKHFNDHVHSGVESGTQTTGKPV